MLVHAATRPGETIVSTTLSEVGHTRLAPPATLVIGPHCGEPRCTSLTAGSTFRPPRRPPASPWRAPAWPSAGPTWRFRERVTTLPAVIAAYLLVAQLLVIPVGLGTSAHLVGTGLAALLVGPEVTIVCVAAVVVVQALLLADGGVTAIGLNVINDGVVPALVTWNLFRLARPLARSPRRQALLGGAAAGVGSLAAAGAAAAAFAIGGTDVVPALTVATAIGGAHLVIAVVEAALTAAILATVLHLRPDLVRATRTPAGGAERAPDPEVTRA